MKRSLLLCLSLMLAGAVHAKLPAPAPLSEEAKAKAAEAAARTAHAGKVEAYKLCRSMDRAAENHFKTAAAMGKSVQSAPNAPACTDPGVFAYTPPKPVEAAEAHSPAATAVSPPSGAAPPAAPTPAK
jgi:hypothetical protein